MLFSDVCLPSLEPSLYYTRGYRLHDEVGDVGLGVVGDGVGDVGVGVAGCRR